jgi:predicted amidohydrolase YtcJ
VLSLINQSSSNIGEDSYRPIGGRAWSKLSNIGNVKGSHPRIEHPQHLSPGAFTRLSELGVIASMHPFHAIDDGRWAEKFIGAERIKTAYDFKSLLDAGAILNL